jgi:hypothetical protein
MSVWRQLQRVVAVEFQEVEPITGLSYQDTRLFVGTILRRLRVVVWSSNLQSGWGVTAELREELAKRVRKLSVQI